MQTVLEALRRAEGPRDRPGRNGDPLAITAIERAAGDLEAFLARLRKERSVDRRRAIAQSESQVVGELDRLLDKSMAGQGSVAEVVLAPFRDQVLRKAIAEITTLCDWTVVADIPR